MGTKTKPAATAPQSKRPGENGFKYRAQYGLIVPCRDEAHQQRLHTRLQKLGMAPKVVCV